MGAPPLDVRKGFAFPIQPKMTLALARLSLAKAKGEDKASHTESRRLSAHQAAEPRNYFGLLANRSSIFGKLPNTASPTVFKLFAEILSSVSSFVCQ